jgi:DNA-directed RNA polymerase subunit RPC12/RpoP
MRATIREEEGRLIAKALKKCPYCGWQGITDGTRCPRCFSLLVVMKLRPKPLKQPLPRPKLKSKNRAAVRGR